MDRPGIYIEKGIFRRGHLRACRGQPDGLVELDLELEGERFASVSSIHVEFVNGAAQAGGYVSWAWIFDADKIAQVETRMAERQADGDGPVDPYQIARGVLEPRYAELNCRRTRRGRPEG